MDQKSHSLLPIFSLLLAATLWGLFWYPLRYMEGQGLSGAWASLLMYLGALILALPWIHKSWPDLRTWPVQMAIVALATGWTNVSFIVAVIDGEVVRVILLFYLSPLWTVILGYWLLGERLTPGAILMLVFAIIGAMIVLWNPGMGVPWPRSAAEWLAISSGMTFALANVKLRSLDHASLASKTLMSWLGVVLVASVWVLLFEARVPVVDSSVLWFAAIFGIVIAIVTLSVVYGVSHMPVHRSAVIMLFEILVAAVSAQMLTNEVLQWYEWLGGSLIVIAALFAAYSHMNE